MELALGKRLDRARLGRAADGLVVAVAVSLPWSTSATGILIVVWLLVLLPTLDLAALRRAVAHPVGGLPVALCAVGLVGMLWADAPFGERLSALQSFSKLLVIPLLLVQFQRSERGMWVAGGFLASCVLLLAFSWLLKLIPSLPSWNRDRLPGVPVKDYIVQSGEFLLCAFALGHLALTAWWQRRRALAGALVMLALLFIANIVFVISSRTTLVVFPVMLLVLALQRLSWKGSLALILGGAVLAATAWSASPFLRQRALMVSEEVARYHSEDAGTSAGYRLEFWRKSIEFVSQAPLMGHGTGSTKRLFREAASGGTGVSAAFTDNPHNQTLIIAVQLGLIGVAVLYAMWLAHALHFRGPGWPSWLGLGVVAQAVVSALFNSQLFYFTPGWIYVFAVGVFGGMVLAASDAAAHAEAGGAR
jgi:O-antigen ligase